MIPKIIIKNMTWQSYYRKICFKVKYIWVKDFFSELNWEKSLISNTVYGRRNLKLFTNCHVFVGQICFSYTWVQIKTGGVTRAQSPTRVLLESYQSPTSNVVLTFSFFLIHSEFYFITNKEFINKFFSQKLPVLFSPVLIL